MVRGCGRRARPDELPVPDSLRRVHAVPGGGPRQPASGAGGPPPPPPNPNCPAGMENGFEKDFAVVWPAPGHRRHAGRHRPHAHAGAEPESLHGGDRAGDRPRRSAARGSQGQSALHRAGRPPDPPRRDRQHRRADAAAERVSGRGVHHERRSAVPAGEHQQRAGRHASTSPTCITASSRSCSGRARASYLRAKIEQYQLDKVASHGRIWRLRYDGRAAVPATDTNIGQPAIPPIAPDFAPPQMYSETPAQLVAHFTHPNGWWRDTAQRLLDPEAGQVGRARAAADGAHRRTTCSRASTRSGRSKGLARSTRALVREAMKDKNPRMRVQAIRASETLYKAGDKSLRRRLPRADEGLRTRTSSSRRC